MHDEYYNIIEQVGLIDNKLSNSEINTVYDNRLTMSFIENYMKQFMELSTTVINIHGLDNNKGLIDKLKTETLNFDLALIQANSTQLDMIALETRDLIYQFFLELNPELLPNIERSFSNLDNEINKLPSSFELSDHFQSFRKVFYELQSAYQTLGYRYDEGKVGDLRTTIHQLEDKLNVIFDTLPVEINTIISSHENKRLLISFLLIAGILLILGIVLIQTSRLEQKLIRARELEVQANRAKSAFLANMSHEIRTPLNGILGMAEILGDSQLNAIQKDYLATINSSSQTLLMLINDILDLSKIESGHLEICPHTAAIKETIFDTAALIAPKAQLKGLDIRINIDQSVPDYIKVDEQKLRQTLMNLASNSIKFTDTGHITFSLSFIKKSADKVTLRFSVKDTGIGIDENKQQQVFEEFKQEDSDTSKNYGGTGLGLAICSKMVEMMGGKLELFSVKGEGCEFFFELEFDTDDHTMPNTEQNITVCYVSDTPIPLLLAEFQRYSVQYTQVNSTEISTLTLPKETVVIFDNDKDYKALKQKFAQFHLVLVRDNKTLLDANEMEVSALMTSPLFGNRMIHCLRNLDELDATSQVINNQTTDHIETDDSRSTFKILVVEDNTVNQKIVALNLKKMSFEYIVANNGQEAIDIYEEQHSNIGLVLMDCMMPVLDGFQATKAIREFEESNEIKQTHIIALTASVLDDDIKKCYESGMDDYLPKPFKRDVLMEKLNSRFQASETLNLAPIST